MTTIDYILDKDFCDVKTYLKKEIGISSKALTKLKTSGIFVNGNEVTVRKPLFKGDILSIVPETKKETNYQAENIPLDIIYDDENFLIINKEAFMPIYPAGIHMTNSLLGAFSFHYPNIVFRPIYRLDRNTSGIVCIAKNKIASSSIINKEYLAICHGITANYGLINKKIGLAENSRIRRDVGFGQTAKTEYWKNKHNNNYSELKVRIHTGRTHQIRVHLASLGHPLAGDDLYGGKLDLINRHALHCKKITIVNKALNFEKSFESIIPNDIKKIMEEQ